ncbi:NLI interacting factor-like phosphatase-domain-containing protein [Mycena polygramma]|nr:NLI interacting factor-like phosphatase-domain-containing protein [Mycena polygramma]
MNSLNYLSRQFDALASARTPPSTPTTEPDSFMPEKFTRSRRDTGSESSSLPRVQTWSTKSFLFSAKPSGSTSKPRPKRSLSSPAGFIAPSHQRPQSTSPAAAAVVSLETSPAVTHLEAVLRRTFIVRVFVFAWNTIRAAWISLSGRTGLIRSREAAVEDGSPALEKDSSDDETSDDHSTSTSLSTPPSPSPSNSNHPLYMSAARPPPDAPISYDSQSESTLPARSLLSTTQATDVSTASRSSTPIANAARRTPFHLPKTLVLDLDETLIHSTSRPLMSGNSSTGFLGLGAFNRNQGSGHMVEVVLGGHSTLYHVYKRPFVDFFLRTVSGWYTLVIFTASMQEYADPVIDWLDAGRGILEHRLFRDSCTQLPNGSYTKDLSVVDPDLSRVCLIDNSPISYRVNEANGIPIEGWTHDPSDEALLDLLPVLDSLRFTSDVRRVLGLRTAGGVS